MKRCCEFCKSESRPLYLGPQGGVFCIFCYPTQGVEDQVRVQVLRLRATETRAMIEARRARG